MAGGLMAQLTPVGEASSTEKNIPPQKEPDTAYYNRYGLRIGIDISKPISQLYRDGYRGLEIAGDYRLRDKLYLAAEIGNERLQDTEELTDFDLYQYTVTGSYVKLGVDTNTYVNWYGEQNIVSIGGRYAFSTFRNTLNGFRIFDNNRYFFPDEFALFSEQDQEFQNLTASWLEVVAGFKAEVLPNIYMGFTARLGFLVSNSSPDNFSNLWIPGFQKVTDGSKFGVGYNYTISYFIPIYKKQKGAAEVDDEEPRPLEGDRQ
jgi:hypothetical protein